MVKKVTFFINITLTLKKLTRANFSDLAGTAQKQRVRRNIEEKKFRPPKEIKLEIVNVF